MRLVVLSDTHGCHQGLEVPDGDILIHAGDFTLQGQLADVLVFDAFLARLPHRHKIVIAGNHDLCFEARPSAARRALRHATYLQDDAVTVEGIRFYGSPWQPFFYDWAFNLRRGRALREKWALVPDELDVLVTHCPPRGHRDRNSQGEAVGCADLLARVREVRPRYHLFGHIHESYGSSRDAATTFVNASICNVSNRPVNKPVVITYP